MTNCLPVVAFLAGIILGAAGVIIFLNYNYRLIDRELWHRFCQLMDDHPSLRDMEDE